MTDDKSRKAVVWKLVPVEPGEEPGPNYAAGLWSRENWRAALQDIASDPTSPGAGTHDDPDLPPGTYTVEVTTRGGAASVNGPVLDAEMGAAAPVELWNGERKVSIYPETVIRVWGPSIEGEMSDEPRTHESVNAAVAWLYAAPPGAGTVEAVPVIVDVSDYPDGTSAPVYTTPPASPAPAVEVAEPSCDEQLAEAERLASNVGHMVVPDPVQADGEVLVPDFVAHMQPSLRALGFHAVPLEPAPAPEAPGVEEARERYRKAVDRVNRMSDAEIAALTAKEEAP